MQLAIAKETAKKLDMGTNILDAASLGDSKKQETAEVAESIDKADGFAQVFPEHKFHIIDVLQKRGHIVGMTGDGVNDAPALKKADCGIAVSGATDAARAAASIVLVAPGLSVIIDAIKESRKIFQRMNSYAIYRIAETLRVLLFMTLAILIFKFYPVTAVMIVMIALLNDGAILSIAYDNVHYRNQPEAWNMRMVLGISTVLGVIGVVSAFGLFYLGEVVFHARPRGHPDADVPEAVRGRASDDLPDAHTRPVLVHTPRADPMDGRARYLDSERLKERKGIPYLGIVVLETSVPSQGGKSHGRHCASGVLERQGAVGNGLASMCGGAKTDSLSDHFEFAQWSRAYGDSEGSWRGASDGLRSRPTIPETGGSRARGSPGGEWGAKVG